MTQLYRIAGLTLSQEIRDLVLKVADEIEAEIKRLEGEEISQTDGVPPPQA